jgi:hypothetical protein
MPPYCASDAQIEASVTALWESLVEELPLGA